MPEIPADWGSSFTAWLRRWWSHLNGQIDLPTGLKLIEVVVALLFLVVSIFIGLAANRILEKQNTLFEEQSRAAARTGSQQYQASLLQAYIATSPGSGFATDEERRRLNLAIDLYVLLRREDRKFEMLSTSMPLITKDQANQLADGRPNDRAEILQLFGRRSDITRFLDQKGDYHIVIGTFRNPQYARGALTSALEALRPTSLRPNMNIMQNQDGFYLATLSSFPSREEAEREIRDQRLSSRFESAYASQSKAWRPICRGQFEACAPPAPGALPAPKQ